MAVIVLGETEPLTIAVEEPVGVVQSTIDVAAQVVAASMEPTNAKETIEASEPAACSSRARHHRCIAQAIVEFNSQPIRIR